MYIYKNYCKTAQSIESDISSNLVWMGSDIQNVTIDASGLLTVQTVASSHNYQLQSCLEPGDMTVTNSEMIELAWLVGAVFVAAYCVKIMKRGL